MVDAGSQTCPCEGPFSEGGSTPANPHDRSDSRSSQVTEVFGSKVKETKTPKV